MKMFMEENDRKKEKKKESMSQMIQRMIKICNYKLPKYIWVTNNE